MELVSSKNMTARDFAPTNCPLRSYKGNVMNCVGIFATPASVIVVYGPT